MVVGSLDTFLASIEFLMAYNVPLSLADLLQVSTSTFIKLIKSCKTSHQL